MIIHSTIIVVSKKFIIKKCTNIKYNFSYKNYIYILSILNQQNSDNNFHSYLKLNRKIIINKFLSYINKINNNLS